jgi:hypothetical protein
MARHGLSLQASHYKQQSTARNASPWLVTAGEPLEAAIDGS